LGPWQQYAIMRMMEHDADGNLLARLALISVARQNGKSVIVRSIVGWMLDEGISHPTFASWDFILLAAHDARQARIPYDFIRRDLESYQAVDRWGHSARRKGPDMVRATMYDGLEAHGVRVDVATRQPGSARGVSPGLICFDEVLTQTDFTMYEVLSPAQSAIRNSQMVMTSTAGFADSVVLRSMHDKLYRQSTNAEQHDPSFMGLWWRADDDDVGLDWDQLQKSNPALGDGRLSKQMITSEYGVLPRGSWVRERLNRWHDERVDSPFSIAAWGACRQRDPLIEPAGKLTIALDVSASWSEGSIIIAAPRSDERIGVVVHRYLKSRPDLPLTAEDFTREVDRLVSRYQVEKIVYSASSALALAMERFGIEKSLPCESVPATQLIKACLDFAEAVASKRIAHDDPHLDSQILSAQRRFVGKDGGWRWSITPNPSTSVIAATLAIAYAAEAIMPVQLFI